MEIRECENNYIKFAKTDRLKNLSIPFLQRIPKPKNLKFEKARFKKTAER